MSRFRRSAVLLLGLGLLALLLFLKGRPEFVAPATTSRAPAPGTHETVSRTETAPIPRPARETVPWKSKPQAKTDVLDKISPGIMAAPAGAGAPFVMRDRYASAYFANAQIAIALSGRKGPKGGRQQGYGLHWSPEGALDADPKPRGERESRVSRMVGDPRTWALDQKTYTAIDYEGILPGIDMSVESRPHGLKYTLYAQPRADLSNLRFQYRGAGGIEVVQDGAGIHILTDVGTVTENELHCWQDGPSGRRVVEARYVALGTDSYQIVLGDHDPDLPTTIDPTIGFSTYIGATVAPGQDSEDAWAIAVDNAANPNVYVTGSTSSVDFPKVGAYDPSLGGSNDIFVTKIAYTPPGAAQIVWSTYLGGSSDETGYAITVDAAQNVYVTGYTNSSDFPMQGNSVRTTLQSSEVFVAKLNPSLVGAAQLVYSTFLGGSDSESGYGIAVDNAPTPNIYVAGYTYSSNFVPIPAGFDTSFGGSTEGFIVKIDGTKLAGGGSAVSWSNFLGGNGYDYIWNMCIDTSANIYLTGATSSSGTTFPLTASIFKGSLSGGYDAFITKVSSTGGLLYSSFMGGNDIDVGYAIAVDNVATPNIYVTGYTYSNNLPTVVTSYQKNIASTVDAFAIKVNTTLSPANQVAWCSYLGGGATEYGYGINVDNAGNAMVSGYTSSITFSGAAVPGFNQTASGSWDGFVARFNTTGTALLSWTYLGGSSTEYLRNQAMDSSGNVYVVGNTYSGPPPPATNIPFPTVNAFQNSIAGVGDAFVTRLNPNCGLVWSSYLGGGNGPAMDEVRRVEFDNNGLMYLTGITNGSDFPPAGNPFNGVLKGDQDCFVTKINPANPIPSQLIWTAYLGGTYWDEPNAMVVDPLGNFLVVGGYSESDDFPHGAAYPNTNGADGFITRINSNGNACTILWSRFLAGSLGGTVYALALDGGGNVYSTGTTSSTNIPDMLVGGYQPLNNGGGDAFVIRHDAATGVAQRSTYFGGTLYETGQAIQIDGSGNVVIAGITQSTVTFPIPPLPTPAPFQGASGGGTYDAFVSRFDSNLNTLNYSTFLGGNNYDWLYDMVLDTSNNIYVTGYTQSPNFPTRAGALSTTLSGTTDVFVSKINPTLAGAAQLVWSTLLGGSSNDYPARIRVDSVGSVYVAGVTYSPDFPLKNAFDTSSVNGEGFITRINNPSGSTLSLGWSTFLGGSEIDQVFGMALGSGGSIVVVGYTQSANFNFPAPPPPMPDTTLNGQEGFITRIDNQDPNMPVVLQQLRTDGVTTIPLGGWTNQTQIMVKASITDAEEDQVRLRVEIKPINVLFDGLGTVDSPAQATGTVSFLVDLPPGNEFHWRCRTVDQHNHLSLWNSFGANGDGSGPPIIPAGRDVGFDNIGPVPTITVPTNLSTYSTTLGTIALQGTTLDNLSGISLVEWRNGNPPPGTFATAGGTVDNWSVGSIPLSAGSGGVNVITVRATDGAGNQGTDTLTVTWDTSAPTLSINSPVIPPAQHTTGSGSVALGGLMGDNNGVTAVNWSRSGGGVPTTNGSGIIVTPTTWNASIPLAPGSNTITVTAVDAAGNTSSGASGQVTVIFDNIPPLINITTTSQTTTLTSFNIVGTASDTSGISQVLWSSNRGPTGTANGTTSWNTNPAPQVQLFQGANVITFTAYDGVNNTAQAVVTITRDVNPPTVTITNPPNAGSHTTATTPLTIGGLATDDIGILKVEWETSLAPGVKHPTVLTPPSPAASTNWIADGVNAVSLSPGLQVITVTVTDTSNRTSTAVLNVTYSASAPSVFISNPPTANHVTSAGSINVIGTATSSAANITGVTVQNLTTGVFSVFTLTGQGTPNTSFTAPVLLVQGTNTIEVKATDSTAAVTTTTLTIISDPTVPAVTITGPTGGDTWAQGTAVLALNGVASDNRGITQVLVSNTTTGVLDQAATLVGPPTSLTWSFSIGLSLLSANNIVVTAKDEAGNSTTDTLTVTYDTTLPDITITTPTSAPNFIAFGVTSITVGGSIGDNVGISTITWSNARNGASGVATGFPVWSAPGVPLDDGINVITVVAKDIAGNTRNDSITIFLDTAIPTIQITAPTNTGSYNTSQATISVGGAAADDIGVAFVTWTSQGVTLKSGTAVGTTAWSIDSIPLDPGNNTIVVTAHDGRNALSDNLLATSRLIVSFDSVKPTLTIQSPPPPTFNTTDTPVLVTGIAGDGVGVTEVSWTNTATGGTGIAGGTTNWSALIPLTSGSNLINVKAKDAAGNTETKSITITYDPAAPLVTVTSPTTAVSITTGTSPITIGGTAQDDVGLASVTWSTGGAPVTVNTVNGFLDWSGPVTLSPGSNDVTFTATDTVGRTGTTRITIIYDPDAPTVTITTPTVDPVYLTTTSTLTLGGVASDNLSVQSVQWSNAATLDTGTAVGVGLWNVQNILLIEGTNDITVTVTDSVGNVSTDMITVIYDGTLPVIAITTPSILPPAFTDVRPFDIIGTASDNLGLGSITFTNDRGGGGVAVPSAPLPALAVNWTASVYLFPGLNVVTVKATDQHGYSSNASITINFVPENSPPIIAITQPPGGSAVSPTQLFDIAGTASDNIGVVTVLWKNNVTGVKGTAVLSVPVPADPDPNLRNWLGTIPLARGANQITVTVVDDADNRTTSTVTVTYDPAPDGVAPNISIVNPNVDVYDSSTAPLLITLSATDNDGIAFVTWANTGTGSSGTATFVTGATWEAPLALSIGPNTIQFTAHDPSGNTAVDDIIVNFTPGPGDIANPVVTITSHPTGVALNVSTPTITLSGIASDNVLVADVVWLNAATSASGGADGTTNWDAPLVLVPGTNVITLRVYDSSGNTDTDQITINFSPPAPVVPAGHCGLLGVEGLVLAGAAWLARRRRR